MYSDEWEAVMTAEDMEKRIEEMAVLAESRAEEDGEPVREVVHDMTHESYLLKHTTADVIRELDRLQELYSDEFYDGDANAFVTSELNDVDEFEYWHDYVYLALAAGLEWAVIKELEEPLASR